MRASLIKLLPFADVLGANIYLVSYAITFSRLLGVAIIIQWFLAGVGKLRSSTGSLLFAAGAVMLMKLLVDLTIHVQDALDPIKLFASEVVCVLMLPAVERLYKGKRHLLTLYTLAAIPAMGLAFVQVVKPSLDVAALVGSNPLLLTEAQRFDYLEVTGRVTGTYGTAIGLALLLGCLFVAYATLVLKRTGDVMRTGTMVVLLVAFFVIIVLTQTRSAIYGVWPSLLLSYLLSTKRLFKGALVLLLGSLSIFVALGAYQTAVSRVSERSVLAIDANTYYKITSNLYGVAGALAEDPLFGVPVDRRLDRGEIGTEDIKLVEKGYRLLGPIFDRSHDYQLMATNHNLFGFYLKYYGIIGFAALIYLLCRIFGKINSKKDDATRWLLMSVFVYIIQYSMLHNTQILQVLLFWILLSCGEEVGDPQRDGIRAKGNKSAATSDSENQVLQHEILQIGNLSRGPGERKL